MKRSDKPSRQEIQGAIDAQSPNNKPVPLKVSNPFTDILARQSRPATALLSGEQVEWLRLDIYPEELFPTGQVEYSVPFAITRAWFYVKEGADRLGIQIVLMSGDKYHIALPYKMNAAGEALYVDRQAIAEAFIAKEGQSINSQPIWPCQFQSIPREGQNNAYMRIIPANEVTLKAVGITFEQESKVDSDIPF